MKLSFSLNIFQLKNQAINLNNEKVALIVLPQVMFIHI